MNGFILLLPFLAVRFILLSTLNGKAIPRAAHFAPVQGVEKIAYCVYQLSNIGILLYPLFLTVKAELFWPFCAGLLCYFGGLLLCALAMVSFSSPDDTGLNTNGIYKFSRNPMYVSYFLCFVGMALLTRSPILLGIILIFQVSAHWMILAEERWCIENWGIIYKQYMERVRRYI